MSEAQAISPGISPIPLQLPGSEGLPPVGDSQPEKKRKQVVSTRTKYISKWKTKACDAVKLLVDRGKMADPSDIAGLESFLAKADQLESNFVTVSDAAIAQDKETNAKHYEEYMEGLRLMNEFEAKCKENYEREIAKCKERERAAEAAELKYRRSEMKNDLDFQDTMNLIEKEKGKRERMYERATGELRKAREIRKEAEIALADAKKRKRDSSSVESGIVRKLVQRCPSCHLCRVCEPMHERYRRSKYGDDSF